MRMRWLGLTGAILVGVALVLGAVGPRLWPTAYGSNQFGGMMSGGMMGNMMGGGMMGNMISGGMMGGGMMDGEFTNDASQPFDLRFLNQMIMHHQGAVMSAQMMIADSARPELRDLAQRIITNQQQQIAQMRQWRQQWYTTSTGTPQETMMAQMLQGNSMMSQEQMRQMMGTPAATDQMFLQMMIPHHQAAIAMAQQALTQAEHAELKTLAQNIITTQQAEIEEMRGYLRAWYGNGGVTQ